MHVRGVTAVVAVGVHDGALQSVVAHLELQVIAIPGQGSLIVVRDGIGVSDFKVDRIDLVPAQDTIAKSPSSSDFTSSIMPTGVNLSVSTFVEL